MTQFNYKGRDQKGGLVKGQIEAQNAQLAAKELLHSQITPLEITPVKTTSSFASLLEINVTKQKIRQQDLVIFCRQLHTLLKAGVSINITLEKIAATSKNKRLQSVIYDLKQKIENGQSFTDALSTHKDVFNDLFIHMVEVGESSGQLEGIFLRLSFYIEQEMRTTRRIKSALRYPTIIICGILAAFIVLNVFVVPAFSGMYAQFEAQLPLPTRILVAISNFMRGYWQVILLLIFILIIFLRMYLKTDKGKYALDWFKLRIPVVGQILYEATLARFCRVFASTMATGIPLLQGMQLSYEILDNRYLQRRFTIMQHAVKQGLSLTASAKKANLFTPLVIQMMGVGEESGSLEDLLNKVAEFYEEEVDYKLNRLTDLIEPIMLIIIGGMILVVALGVFLPTWNMINFIRK